MRQWLLAVVVLLLALMAGHQACAQVYPTLDLTSFDAITGTYLYTVTCPADSTYAFGYLQIDTMVANAAPTGPWTIDGPFVNGENKQWPNAYTVWDPDGNKTSAWWDPFSRTDVVSALTYWQGEFVLIVPSSQPEAGAAATKDGQSASYHVHYVDVPGSAAPAVPEPCTLLGLSGLLGFTAAAIRRRTR